MTTVTMCDYCSDTIKGDIFNLDISKQGTYILQKDMCSKCKNALTRFLDNLGPEEG